MCGKLPQYYTEPPRPPSPYTGDFLVQLFSCFKFLHFKFLSDPGKSARVRSIDLLGQHRGPILGISFIKVFCSSLFCQTQVNLPQSGGGCWCGGSYSDIIYIRDFLLAQTFQFFKNNISYSFLLLCVLISSY